jgi:hypothetical protein
MEAELTGEPAALPEEDERIPDARHIGYGPTVLQSLQNLTSDLRAWDRNSGRSGLQPAHYAVNESIDVGWWKCVQMRRLGNRSDELGAREFLHPAVAFADFERVRRDAFHRPKGLTALTAAPLTQASAGIGPTVKNLRGITAAERTRHRVASHI